MTDEAKEVYLKPCPFCGDKAVAGEIDGTFFVTCCNCFTEQYPNDDSKWTKEQAIKAWNTRVSPSPSLVPLNEKDVERIIIKRFFQEPTNLSKSLANEICSTFALPQVTEVPSVEDIEKEFWKEEVRCGFKPAYKTLAKAIHALLKEKK